MSSIIAAAMTASNCQTLATLLTLLEFRHFVAEGAGNSFVWLVAFPLLFQFVRVQRLAELDPDAAAWPRQPAAGRQRIARAVDPDRHHGDRVAMEQHPRSLLQRPQL